MPNPLKAADIKFIVPGTDGKAHNLYLANGLVVRISAHSGEVWGVYELPSYEDIQAAREKGG